GRACPGHPRLRAPKTKTWIRGSSPRKTTYRRFSCVPKRRQGASKGWIMAEVVMADDGIAFDGATAERGPLGGAETALAALADALAGRGHRVVVRNRCRSTLDHNRVHLAPLSDRVPPACDLCLGSPGQRVIGLLG